MKQQIKDLWKLCFEDSEEFIDMYFRLRYSKDVNIAIQSGEEVIAAMQMVPYPMTYGGGEINTAYVSGACTHPDYRGRGVMHELLSQAFIRMLGNNVAVSTLIPAEPWLFGYYARHGYVAVFNYMMNTFTAAETEVANEAVKLETNTEYEEDVYEYLNRKLRERPCCIQHTEKDFRVILADLQLSEGCIYTLKNKGRIVALAVAYPTKNGNWYIGEIVWDSDEMRLLLLQRICRELNIPAIKVITPPIGNEAGRPLGMARIINAKTMLQLYAATHPEIEANIHLTDEQVSANNGYYYLSNGKCMKSAKRLPGSHLALTIGKLTERIFAASSPYMSLMLN